MEEKPTLDQLPTRVSLLDRLKNAEDAGSWEEFFSRYQAVVRSIARGRGLSEHEAEEVVMEVFLRVAQTIGSFKSRGRPGSFRSWLFQLTRWRAQDKIQDRLRKGAGSEDIANHEEKLLTDAAQGEFLEKEARKLILDTLFHRLGSSVPQKQLQAFRMMVVDEVPVEKVCELFKITPNFAYVIRHRVLAKLRVEARKIPLGKDR